MQNKPDNWKARIDDWISLDLPDRMSEVLFGLIMVLTFTGTISASTAGRQEIGQLLWAALGCNLAWGLVDAIMYLMDTLIGRGHNITQIVKIRNAMTTNISRKLVRENIPPILSGLVEDQDVDKLVEKIKNLPEPSKWQKLVFKDFLVAGEIFMLVFLSTFPVVLPFLFFSEVAVAMRVSNAVAIMLIFAAGYSLAKYSGLRPFRTALIYTGLGLLLVAITMILGG